jgi:nicotinamide-nucleotide amidase
VIVEVLAVGTELLLGQIVNTNAATIGARLAEVGLDHHHQGVVGDNHDRMVAAIRLALSRADAVVITGGLGPTQDDMTREAIAAATGRELRFDTAYAERLRSWWRNRGRGEMPESNLKQAEYPEGATLLTNRKGTAPGIQLHVDGKWVFAVPGVPAELVPLLDEQILPLLQRESGAGVVMSRVIRTYGESESRVGEMLADVYEAASNPTVAFLASAAEIKVRLTAKAATREEAEALIAPVEARVRERLGRLVFGVDEDTIEAVLLRLLEERRWTLGTAESATGGLIAARITSVPGASQVFRGAVVAYQREVKERVLGVASELIDEHGVVSEPVAVAMAEGAAARLGADVVVSITGSAGPDPQEREVGTMIVGLRTPERAMARTLRMPGDRERIRTYTTTGALHLARLAITGEWWSGPPRSGRWI